MDEKYPEIELREIKEDDFRKGILSGEVRPHDVKIIVKFHNGKTRKTNIDWKTVHDVYQHHNMCAVGEMYELLIDSFV